MLGWLQKAPEGGLIQPSTQEHDGGLWGVDTEYVWGALGKSHGPAGSR